MFGMKNYTTLMARPVIYQSRLTTITTVTFTCISTRSSLRRAVIFCLTLALKLVSRSCRLTNEPIHKLFCRTSGQFLHPYYNGMSFEALITTSLR